jgi:predicted MPP superfamily phosphohydrolase
MRAGFPVFISIIIVIILMIDFYTFRGIRILTASIHPWFRFALYTLYWSVPLIIFCIITYMIFNFREVVTTKSYKIFYFMVGLLMAVYVPKLVFIAFQFGNDLIRFMGYIITKLTPHETKLTTTAAAMTRSEFLIKMGIIVAFIPFISIIQGITKGRFNYQVKNLRLIFNNLPKSFDGFRILQISDWHIGSFIGHETKVKESVDLINKQAADLILFTGDFVNNVAEELEGFVSIVGQIKAPYGVYSILGNHDYGEYIPWDSEEAHAENMLRLFRHEENAGFKLLRNESVILEKNHEKIGIAGVENWGLHPFPQYGDIDKAMKGIRELPFKIVMSHDPTHWDVKILGKTDADLTLSGHTHGMQFGINLPGLKWSPIKWRYPRWCGLYQEGSQYLYVNVGIGYIAFPGRVGFLPEITVFELHKED